MIEDMSGKVLWEEFSQKPESMRPWFLIPGVENKDLMEKICARMDKEAENLQTFEIKFDNATIKINVEYHLAIDGKLIEMSSGLSESFSFVKKYLLVTIVLNVTSFSRWIILYLLRSFPRRCS